MANEYLKRRPTSVGNKKVFTWSGWVKTTKESKAGSGNDIFFCAAADNGNAYHRTRIGKYVQTEHDFGLNHYDGANDNYATQADFRDFSSWSHYLCSVDTTKEQTTDRVKIYVNGVYISDLETVTAANQNLDTFINDKKTHFIGADAWVEAPSTIAKLSMFDVFLVDGQALTPDVFGFYKDGKGYISAGTTQAADFRPGQWVPHTPRRIKSEINRRGGFGVNGFYLPMNDSSNFGADFHCDPNSIIKLKGEDLPQPRNGAPETTSVYISELRTDPYAANLVLAVPGISTATGSNLITNGNFDSNVSNWTATDCTTAWENGQLKITRTAGGGLTANQTFTTETGKRYTISGTINSSGSRGDLRVYNGSGTGGSLIINLSGTNGSVTHLTGSFTATSTAATVVITIDNNNTVVYADNIVVRQEDAPRDYSADIKGSGTNKTLIANGNAGVGYEIPGYYGSALSIPNASAAGGNDCLRVTDNDFAMGTGDFTVEVWINPDSLYDYQTIFSTRPNNGPHTDGFNMWINLQGATGVYSNAFLTQTANGTITANQWTHVVAERYSGTLTTYINGVAAAVQASNTQNYTRTIASIGQLSVNDLEAFTGQMQDLRVYKGVAKYKGGFDVPKPYTPVGFEGESWRQVSDNCKNNFATLNQLDTSQLSPSNGNLSIDQSSGGWHSLLGTHYARSGKWYAEMRIDRLGWIFFGVEQTWLETRTRHIGGQTGSKGAGLVYNTGNRGDITYNGTNNAYTGGDATAATGDILSIALDLDNNNVKFYKNNVLQYNLSNILESGVDYAFGVSPYSNVAATVNFGQNPTFSGQTTAGTYTDSNGKGLFKYEPPSGFLALCEDNLPTPAIADPGEHFKTVLYTGSGSARAVTGVGFKPDLVWIKKRSTAGDHKLIDSVRGAGLILESNTTDIEGDETGNFSGFSNDGFDLSATTAGAWNENPYGYVAWCWKAGGAAVSNTDGTITSQVSVNQDAGFSIVSYDGSSNVSDTVGHSLGKTPSFIILKSRTQAYYWRVYHKFYGSTATQGLLLGQGSTGTTGSFSHDQHGGIGSVTSTTFGFGTNGTNTLTAVNKSGEKHIAYCWAEIEGYSKFGSYVGNGNADGPFVYCGFKPALIMVKRTSDTGNWIILDSSRSSTNPVNERLYANLSNTESISDTVDFLSNGFKFRTSHSDVNNGTYIFAAFAESPFSTANAK